MITTSHFPGTTLDMIEIPLDDDKALYDTPGIINHHQMAHYLDPTELKFITPKKEIKPKVFQLNSEQTLFLGGLSRLTLSKENVLHLLVILQMIFQFIERNLKMRITYIKSIKGIIISTI